MKNMYRLSVLFLVANLFAGCGSSPPTRFYALQPTLITTADALDMNVNGGDAISILVGPFDIPEYLNRTQIVTRTDDTKLNMAEFDRWAEPLASAFHRTLAVDLGNELRTDRVAEFTTVIKLQADYRLIGRVLRFEIDDNKMAILEVQWGLGKGNDDASIRRSRYEKKVASSTDFIEGAKALSSLIADFSRDVAAEYRSVNSVN